MVECLRPWFHCIDLGYGIQTKTESAAGEPINHPKGTWETIRQCLPEDIRGKSVLDVGCNAGFYAIEAKRRGAAHVLGVDAQRIHIRQALFVREVLELEIGFRRMSVYDLTPHTVGQFDITLALGLIYHCKHFVQALENLCRVTRDLLIIETAIYPPEKGVEPFPHPIAGAGQVLHSFAYVENPPDAQEPIFNWFLPSVAGLCSLLRNLGIQEIVVYSVEGSRGVFICHKGRPQADSRLGMDLAAVMTLVSGPRVCEPSSQLAFHIRAENSGFAIWLAEGEPGTGKGMVQLGAHLLKEDGTEVEWNYGRAVLKSDLAVGGAAYFDIYLKSPNLPGTYYVEFDMLAEHLTWFEDLGSSTLRHELCVQPVSR
jgi:tRNA (mo5U34)-methyltransferase